MRLGIGIGIGLGGANPSPPVNTEAPVITGTPVVGESLTCSTGSWNGAVSFTYQWYFDSVSPENIRASSDTNTIAEIQQADSNYKLICQVTASNSFGSTAAASAPTETVTLPD